MFKKLFKDIFVLIKSIISNQSLVSIVRQDVSQLVGLVAARDFTGAAMFLLNNINTLSQVDASNIIKQAAAVGVDIYEFLPVIGKINEHVYSLPWHKATPKLEMKAQDAITLIENVVNRKENKGQ